MPAAWAEWIAKPVKSSEELKTERGREKFRPRLLFSNIQLDKLLE
jgi:hypothetical protein